jgi:hypothetical protein
MQSIPEPKVSRTKQNPCQKMSKLGRIHAIKQPVQSHIKSNTKLSLKKRIWKHTETPFYLLVIAVGLTTTGMMLYEFGKYLLDPHIENKVFNEAALMLKNSPEAKRELGEYFQTRLGMVYKNSNVIVLEVICKKDDKFIKAQVEASVHNDSYQLKNITLLTEKPILIMQERKKGIFGFGQKYR